MAFLISGQWYTCWQLKQVSESFRVTNYTTKQPFQVRTLERERQYLIVSVLLLHQW